MKLVSVIIRTLDRPAFLKDALRSVARQSYSNIETIIVNDGGNSLVKEIGSWNLSINHKLIEFPSNKGRSYAANQGLQATSGDYIAFLDDDDIWYPFHVERLIEELNKTNADIVYSDALEVRQVKSPYIENKYLSSDALLRYSKDHSLREILKDNFIPMQTLMFKKECIKNETFDQKLDVLEDWDMWIRLSKTYKFVHIKEITSEYRIRNDGTNIQGSLDHLWWWARDYLNKKHTDLRESFNLEPIQIR